MGETPLIPDSSSSSTAKNSHAHPQPTHLPVADDEDEPPGCSGIAPQAIHNIDYAGDSQVQQEKVESPTRNVEGGIGLPVPEIVGRSEDAKQAGVTPPQVVVRRPTEGTRVSRFRTLFRPAHPIGPVPGYKASLKAAVKYTPLNICLAFIPVSWALHYTHQSNTLIFIFSSLAIVPLAALLGLGTEQIALRTSQAVGGLLNATLGNIVEMIIAGIALKECDLALVQSSLLGGLLSNLLLVLGGAFIVGGFRFPQQEFQPMVAQLNSSLMTVSVISLLVPAAFHEYLGDRLGGEEGPLLLQLSRGSAIILILIYIAYLFFQFYSHSHLFMDVSPSTSCRTSIRSSLGTAGSTTILPLSQVDLHAIHIETPKLNVPTAIGLLVGTTALAYLTAENLVHSLNGLVEHTSVSKEWITLIIIPIISNAAEHVTAVVVASKGKFDLAMSVAVGSCIQIALFVIPALILISWGLGKPLTLLFDPIETMCLFLSVLIVKFSIEDGKSHWMSGVSLIGVYLVIALSFWNYPAPNTVQPADLVCT
ncbi:calcium/proton exchanger [Panus rudis PR-1116 ss-1]|nr:calcium/proton exchanger [Panus rudis PR-1116 ss-1]